MSNNPNPKLTVQNPFVVSVYSPKGGTGKTTLSLMLADYFAVEGGYSVALIDRDLQKSLAAIESLAAHLGTTLPFTIYGEEPDAPPAAQVYVLDHGPRIGEEFIPPSFTDVVVMPAQPSFLDFSSIQQSQKVMQAHGFKTVHLFSRFKKNIPDHMTLRDQFPTYPVIQERNVYPRAAGMASGVFSLPKTRDGKSIYGLSEAREEIRELVKQIEKTSGVTLIKPPVSPVKSDTQND